MDNKGSIDKPKIRLIIFSEEDLSRKSLENIENELAWRFGFNEDVSDFCDEFKKDEFLEEPISSFRGMRIDCSNSLYEIIVISILLQNCVIRRTIQMMNNLLNEFGRKLVFDGKELTAFWNPEDIVEAGEEKLRELKLGYRAKTLLRISHEFSMERIDKDRLRNLSTEEALKKITKLHGIGPASAQIILGEYLRRFEFFSLKGKTWEQKLLSRIMFNKPMIERETLEEEIEKRYAKWRYLACFYMLQNLFWKHEKKRIEWLEKEIRR